MSNEGKLRSQILSQEQYTPATEIHNLLVEAEKDAIFSGIRTWSNGKQNATEHYLSRPIFTSTHAALPIPSPLRETIEETTTFIMNPNTEYRNPEAWIKLISAACQIASISEGFRLGHVDAIVGIILPENIRIIHGQTIKFDIPHFSFPDPVQIHLWIPPTLAQMEGLGFVDHGLMIRDSTTVYIRPLGSKKHSRLNIMLQERKIQRQIW